ncbi:glia maturation factor beta [Macrosteles quadrilineatus]|uniref:glia maturation factor beta n=1 Tax=Macrosteles quadrilineatus TaxID=74068 RepID=UPI0023E2E513|nr:glia maturation factor beta [Macrosteles quadrilineatus]
MSMKVCDIEDDVKDALRQFRFRKHNNNAALILKVDREKQKICIDSMVEDTCLDDLRDILPGHQPRYVVYSNKMEHSDGRISYPLSFIYITPQDSQRDLQVMYAGTKLALQKEADLTRVYEVRELDELTDEWLKEKLSK